MKKSTIIIILLVYLASIIAIGFFGMKVKIYDEIKYIKSIEMSVGAQNEEMYKLIYKGKDKTTNDNLYYLMIKFTDNHLFDQEGKEYIALNLIPYVTYDTGDVASEGEKIKYEIDSTTDYEGLGYVKLDQVGTLHCYKSGFAFKINVFAEKKSGFGTGAIIRVFIV